jgi:quercetin dioxygenase-like cupin family protein
MEIEPKEPTMKGGTDAFTGDVWIDVIARGKEPSRVRVNVVHFAPGARTAWHAHAVGQTIHVTEGLGRVQARGGDLIAIRAGDGIDTPPGEWHWHGAAPDHFMSHLAIWEAPAGGGRERVGEADHRPGVPCIGDGADPMTDWTPLKPVGDTVCFAEGRKTVM